MPINEPLSVNQCQEAVRLFLKNDKNKAAAAREAGVPVNTFKYQLNVAAKRGYLGYDPVLPGFSISKISTQHDVDGEVTKTHIQQRPESLEPFALPSGHEIKGISALVGPDGEVIQKWIKTTLEISVPDVVEAIREALQDFDPLPEIQTPRVIDSDLLTVYCLADLHLGMLSWKPETGDNYDLKIAQNLVKDTVQKLTTNTPSSETAVLLNLGDFFHSDNDDNRTKKSGNVLDVDGRHIKVFKAGLRIIVDTVRLLLTKHKKVILRNNRGNHDPDSSIHLNAALELIFSDNPRVEIDEGTSPWWKYRFGKVLLTSTHGDMTKNGTIHGYVAAAFSQDWGLSEYRYCYLGHLHKKILGNEDGGLIYEVFQTIAAKDYWATQSGYHSGRSMVAITHNKEMGEVLRHTVSIPKVK